MIDRPFYHIFVGYVIESDKSGYIALPHKSICFPDQELSLDNLLYDNDLGRVAQKITSHYSGFLTDRGQNIKPGSRIQVVWDPIERELKVRKRDKKFHLETSPVLQDDRRELLALIKELMETYVDYNKKFE